MDNSLTVLAELRKCGLTDNENCLKAVTLSMSGGDTVRVLPAGRAGGAWGARIGWGPGWGKGTGPWPRAAGLQAVLGPHHVPH